MGPSRIRMRASRRSSFDGMKRRPVHVYVCDCACACLTRKAVTDFVRAVRTNTPTIPTFKSLRPSNVYKTEAVTRLKLGLADC